MAHTGTIELLDIDPGPGGKPAPRGSSAQKLAQRLADAIERSIVRAGWPVGAFIGAERDLLERYGVGRSVFREAVRLLENHQVATMRVGRSGGLVVTRPDPSALTHTAALYLDFEGAVAEQLYEPRIGIELTAVRLVIDRLDDGAISALHEEIRREQAQLDGADGRIDGHAFHLLLASLSQNPVVRLFEEVLIELRLKLERDAIEPSPVREQPDGIYRFAQRSLAEHRAIVDAIVARDLDRSVELMRSHLRAVAADPRNASCVDP